MIAPASSTESGSRITCSAAWLPAQSCRVSNSSCRAVANSRIGASSTASSRWSRSSRNVGAATWMSSTIATSGRRPAIASRSLRIPQNSSGPANWVVVRPIADATRSMIAVGSSESPVAATAIAAIFAIATSDGSSSLMPAAPRTISAIGQNVTPSPYGRQRPRRTWLRSPVGRPIGELPNQARLSDPGVTDDRDQPARPGHRDLFERSLQPRPSPPRGRRTGWSARRPRWLAARRAPICRRAPAPSCP